MKKLKKTTAKQIDIYKAVLLIISAILITVGVTSIIYSAYKIADYKEYPIYLQVASDNQLGFDIRKDAISFGKVPVDSTGIIKINLAHNSPNPLNVVMESSGQTKKFVVITENNFVLEPGVTKTIEIYAVVPANAQFGNYTGKLEVLFKRI